MLPHIRCNIDMAPIQTHCPFDAFDPEIFDAISNGDAHVPSLDAPIPEHACPHCGSHDAPILDDGFWSCTCCSSVIDRFVDYGAEWRTFFNEDGRGGDISRCGQASSDLIAPLGCVLRVGGRTTGTKSQTSRSSVGAYMMSKHQAWSALTYRERSLCKVFEIITARATSHGLPASFIQEAKTMYKQVSQDRIFRGASRDATVAACVYMACRSNHAPRSINEIATMFAVSRTSMIKGCNVFHEALPRNLDCCCSEDFVARFCSRLCMSDLHTCACRSAVARVDDLFLVSDCTPSSIVGGVIQLVNIRFSLGLKRDDIATACMVAPGTVARCASRLHSHANMLLASP